MKKYISICLVSICLILIGFALGFYLPQKEQLKEKLGMTTNKTAQENNVKNSVDESESEARKAINEIAKIANETQACLDNGEDNAYCCEKAKEAYNNEIDKTMKNLKKVLSESQYKKLVQAQEKWEEFINSDNVLAESTLQSCNASMPVMMSVCDQMDIIRTRAQGLKTIYVAYPEFSEDCFGE